MSMMAYPSFLKVITGCLSWGRGSDSQAAPPLWRVTAAALNVRASRPPAAQREIGVKKTNELRWRESEREERCDAANADDHFVGISAPGCIQLGPIPCLVGSLNEL